jgi:divalent metal cation (Fe/Co/Zn/Cd) transporter
MIRFAVSELIQIGSRPSKASMSPERSSLPSSVLWLQSATVAWMLVELGVSAFAAWTARSPVILAFGADSLVEVLSAMVVLLQFWPGSTIPGSTISERQAARASGLLLFVLAFVVAGIAVVTLALRIHPEVSRAGIGITIAALVAMPILAKLKRREARRSKNVALAADAVQSATCAYLAMIALAGLAWNAAFHVPWVDSVAALAAIPFLIKEGRVAWQGHRCGCC